MRFAQERGIDLAQVKGSGPDGKITREDVEAHPVTAVAPDGENTSPVRATPNARRLAAELSVDLNALTGSGPNGRVQGSDVRRAHDQTRDQKHTAATAQPMTARSIPATHGASQPPQSKLPYAGMRKTIGTRLLHSYQQAPHVTFSIDVDVTAAESLRVRANAKLGALSSKGGTGSAHSGSTGEQDAGLRVSLTAIIAKACAWALMRQPLMNACLDLDASEIRLSATADIGIAVALTDGLIVPVVRQVESKGLMQIARDIAGVTARAKANKLKAEDLGGTFTISNLGMFGIDRFTAIINPPETAILAVGRAKKVFVPDANDMPVLRPLMTLTLSADHRVIDGALAALFMADVREAIEQPDSILF